MAPKTRILRSGFLGDRTLAETERLGRECHRETARFMAGLDEMTIDRARTGAEPPLVDYIAWLWTGRPQSNWP